MGKMVFKAHIGPWLCVSLLAVGAIVASRDALAIEPYEVILELSNLSSGYGDMLSGTVIAQP